MPHLTPSEALIAAVQAVGSQGAMGRLLGVSQPSVYRWLRAGEIPPEYVLAVEAETGVSKHDLRPDIYPLDLIAAPAASAEHLDAAR